MKDFSCENIKNVALAGHSGAGKTSLTEAMLFLAGVTDRLGKVADGNTVCDYDAEDIKRKASVSTSVAPFVWKEKKINAIDTPGLFDFAGGVYEGMRACKSVLIPISGRSGLSVGAEKAYEMAEKYKKAKMIFINKLDRESADYYKVLEQLKAAFGPSICPIVAPIMEDHKVKCYVDLIEQEAFSYDAKGKPQKVEMPDLGHRMEGLIAAISEAVAETDEDLFEKYFSGEAFTREELLDGIYKGTLNGTITPLLCGSATTLEGVDCLMNYIARLLPSAKDGANETAETADGDLVEVSCDIDAPVSAFVFKSIADPFIGKLSFVKVVSGVLKNDSQLVNARTGQPEKMGKLVYIRGKKQEDTSSIPAGDIGVITKLTDTRTGDSLCDPKRVLAFEGIEFPIACMSMAIKVAKQGDEAKAAQGLQRLREEDPVLHFETNHETHQQILSGLGDQHLDCAVSKLKAMFGVDVTLEKPIVAYRETIRKKVEAPGRYKKQTGGHGQFGDVKIIFEPCDSEELVFEEQVFGGAVPKSFFPAVEKGLQDCVKHGVLAGYPVVGLKATLIDGSYHPVDSSEMSFKLAAGLAYKAGLPQASPALLEPIGSLKVLVPDSYTGDIMGDINKRRGRVLGMNPVGRLQEIEAEVPSSEMADFTSVLRSVTQGRGSFTFEFVRYEQLPSNLEAAVIEQAKALGVARDTE